MASRRRSHLVLVLGGASSGKSDAALKLAARGINNASPRIVVATAEGLDEEMAMKIARHRQSRSPAWETAEVPIELTTWFTEKAKTYRIIVVDCLTMWLSNLSGIGKKDQEIREEAQTFLRSIRRIRARVVLVSNELGMGVVPGDPISRWFRELSGNVNRLVAEEADEAYLIVSGMPIRLK